MPTTAIVRPVLCLCRLAILALALGVSAHTPAWGTHGPEKREYVAVFPAQFPPVYTTGANNTPRGFGIEVMEHLAEQGKFHVVYHSTRTWDEAYDILRKGKADFIPNLGITPERQKDFSFSLPLTRTPVSLFVRVETRDIDNLEDLIKKGRLIATVRINVSHEVLANQAGTRLQTFDTPDEAFTALHTGAVDALAYLDAAVDSMEQRLGHAEHLRRIDPPLVVLERAVAVRKGDNALLAMLNREIEAFVRSPHYKIVYERWYGEPDPFWTASRVVVLAAVLLGLALGLGVYGRLRLIRSANAFSNAVLETIVEGILAVDAKGIVHSANPAAERIFGRSKKEIIGTNIRTLLTDVEAERLQYYMHQMQRQPAYRMGGGVQSVGLRPGGGTIPIRLSLAPMSLGKTPMFVCTVSDQAEQAPAAR